MCTYVTHATTLRGGAKGGAAWRPLRDACVYVDHPYFSSAAHTLNIDFRTEAGGPGERVAVELELGSARELVAAIEAAITDFERGG